MNSLAAPIASRSIPIAKLLLAGGVFSSLYYIAINVVVPMQYPGYDVASQTVSELSAIDAPTRDLWVTLCIPYSLLAIAFGAGVWMAGGKLRIVGAAMVAQSVVGLFWPPMHQREVLAAGGGDMSDTLHIAFTAVWGVFSLLVLGFGAAALGRAFRLYTFATVVVLLGFGLWTAVESPGIQANLPTPWIGVAERINMGAYMLWVAVLSIALLRAPARGAD